MDRLSYDGPIVLAILDGVGLAPDAAGNAVSKARTPFLGDLAKNYFHKALEASGEAVGLDAGQMGNSEVGHNTMGAGHAESQGARHIDKAFSTNEIWNSPAWAEAVRRAKNGATLHFAGIFSDGGVHSDLRHLEQMIERAYREGVRKMRVHAVFDGRDVGPYTALDYIKRFEDFARRFETADVRLATGGGRMVFIADRYENDWQVVAKGWDALVNAEAQYFFKDATEAINTIRRIYPEIQDQYLPPFVLVNEDDSPVGQVRKGDALIYFDFRADRAIEIAEAFTYYDFPHFSRGNYSPDDVYFVGMTEYNSDTHVPDHRLAEPLTFGETLPKFLADREVTQLAISETVKFGHVTYYFNGNSYGKLPGEEHIEIASYTEPFETRPWMRAAEITDEVLRQMSNYRFIRVNYPGGDMVGHTADLPATILALEAIDLSLRRLAVKVDELGGVLVVVADHGNAEELLDENGQPKTAHTTNKVPLMIYDNTANREKYADAGIKEPGLANIAATVATLLGLDDYPNEWEPSLIRVL